MSKLEDKLAASLKPSKRQMPPPRTTSKPKTIAQATPVAATPGVETDVAANVECDEARDAGVNAARSALHPGRIWPD